MIRYVSLGENCLADELLKKVMMKGESYPFGSGRFNIEYINSIIEEDFKNLLNPAHLRYETVDGKQVVKNTLYKTRNNIFCPSISSGYEFTHHDVFNEKDKLSVERKIKRFREILKSKDKVVFIYNYRYSEKQNIGKITELLNCFLGLIKTKYKKEAKLILFYQTITDSIREYAITFDENIVRCEFKCKEQWVGDDNYDGSKDMDLFRNLLADRKMARLLLTPKQRLKKTVKELIGR